MKIKYLLAIISLLFIVSGCQPTIKGELVDVLVKEKRTETGEVFHEGKIVTNLYYVVLEKDGQEVELKVRGEDLYNSMRENSTVSVQYNEYLIINSVKFTGFKDNFVDLEQE